MNIVKFYYNIAFDDIILVHDATVMLSVELS